MSNERIVAIQQRVAASSCGVFGPHEDAIEGDLFAIVDLPAAAVDPGDGQSVLTYADLLMLGDAAADIRYLLGELERRDAVPFPAHRALALEKWAELLSEVARLRVALDAIRAGATVCRGLDALWAEIAETALAGREPESENARRWLAAARAEAAREGSDGR